MSARYPSGVIKWPVSWDRGDAPYRDFSKAITAASQRADYRGKRQQVRRVRLEPGWRWVVQDQPFGGPDVGAA